MTRKQSADTNPSFDKIGDALGTSFDGEEIIESVNKVIERKKDIESSTDELKLGDAEYMKAEITSCIASLETVMNTLEQDLKIGSQPRMYEVYATMANTKMSSVKELRELNKVILDLKLKLREPTSKGGSNGPKNLTVNNYISHKDLLGMMTDAKKNNSLNKVSADFKIVDEEKTNEKK